MKAVIFDNDGVLVNSEETAVLNDAPFLAQFGLKYTTQEYAALMSGQTGAAFLKRMNEECIRQTGSPLPEDFPAKLKENYRYQVANLLKAIEGAADLVHMLRESGIPIAVASNGEHESLRRKLEKAELYDTFRPHIYNKDDCGGIPKPAPNLYLYAMKQIEIDDPADCIVVEDSPTGIAAGKAAGMYVVGYAGGQHRDPNYRNVLLQSGADVVVSTMAEASEIIQKLVKPAETQKTA